MTLFPKLNMLVLAGGQSRRMGMDKSRIEVNGLEQEIFIADLGKKLGVPTYISKGVDYEQPTIAGYPVIKDHLDNKGPLSAIHAAFEYAPEAAWLVVACDLPFIQSNHLISLIEARKSDTFATAFQIKGNAFPEPLICIYEPTMRAMITKALEDGKLSPMKLLQKIPITTVALDEPKTAFNVNTPEALAVAKAWMKQIHE